MEFSSSFKEVIKTQFDALALVDKLFAKTYSKPNKNLDDCVKYILEQVRKANVAGWADDDIFNMGMHYYQEDDIKAPTSAPKCKIVINREVQLTDEEVKKAKQDAIEKVISEQKTKIQSTATKKQKAKESSVKPQQPQQLSMF
jgi:hypothetical protein